MTLDTKMVQSKLGRVVKALALGASLERGTGSNPVACTVLQKKGRARFEPATYRAATDCSTTELTPHLEKDAPCGDRTRDFS